MAQYTVSIIIPVLNEAAIIQSKLEKLQLHTDVEIIVVDGGSKDNTVEIVQARRIKTLIVTGGRSAQMNAGADIARGEILLFLHVDTDLPENFGELVREALNQPQVIAGAFELAIDGENLSLRWIEALVKIRSHLFSLPYGDQAIFLTKNVFEEIEGFTQMPIMEDFELIRRLKRQGKIAIVPGKVTTSGRRWQKLGVWKTTLTNQLVIAGYYLGISPRKLGDFYRNRQNSK